MEIKKRHHIRSSKKRDLTEKLKPKLGDEIEEILEGNVEKAEMEDDTTVFLVEDRPFLFKNGENYIPLIFEADKLLLKKIVVDMGAVKHVTNGADIMAPGIVKAEDGIEKEDIVTIEDEENQKTIAIGKVLETGMEEKDKGKMVENLHYVGDDFWTLQETF